MPEPNDAFWLAQVQELAKFEDARVNRYLRYLDDARKAIGAEIRGAEQGAGYERLRSLSKQIDGIAASLEADFKGEIDVSKSLARLVAEHQSAALSVFAGEAFTVSADVLSSPLLASISEAGLYQITSLARNEVQSIKSVLFTRVGVLGENPRQVAKDITGPESLFAKRFSTVENILRTETNTIYNDQRLTSLDIANDQYDLGLNKRIMEKLDTERNHPISRVLNNQVRKAKDPFTARVSDVRAQLRIIGRKMSSHSLDRSIFWPKKGEFYVGQNLPAHYRERGVMVPTQLPVTD